MTVGSFQITHLTHLERIRSADSVWQLRAEGRRDAENVKLLGSVVNRHLASLAVVVQVAKALVRHLAHCESAPEEDALLSVLPKHLHKYSVSNRTLVIGL